MSQLFGFQINRKEGRKGQSPVPPNADEAIAIAAGGYYGTYVDTDNQARNEFEMIRRYRDMALHPEVDSAVDEVVNEFVVSDSHDTPIEINLDNLDAVRDPFLSVCQAQKSSYIWFPLVHELTEMFEISNEISYGSQLISILGSAGLMAHFARKNIELNLHTEYDEQTITWTSNELLTKLDQL